MKYEKFKEEVVKLGNDDNKLKFEIDEGSPYLGMDIYELSEGKVHVAWYSKQKIASTINWHNNYKQLKYKFNLGGK